MALVATAVTAAMSWAAGIACTAYTAGLLAEGGCEVAVSVVFAGLGLEANGRELQSIASPPPASVPLLPAPPMLTANECNDQAARISVVSNMHTLDAVKVELLTALHPAEAPVVKVSRGLLLMIKPLMTP